MKKETSFFSWILKGFLYKCGNRLDSLQEVENLKKIYTWTIKIKDKKCGNRLEYILSASGKEKRNVDKEDLKSPERIEPLIVQK